MSITFTDALDNNLISDNIIKMLPRKCKCGADYVFNDSLKEIQCTNKDCSESIVNRCRTFVNKTGISVSEEGLRTLITKFKMITPFQLMMLDEVYSSGLVTSNDVSNIDDIVQNIKNIKQNELLIYEIVKLCCIENISNTAERIFGGFESVSDAYDEIEAGQISFINERLGIKSSDSSIFSFEIFNELIDIKEELLFAETQFNVKKIQKKSLRIAFADNILPFVNKMELIDMLNYRFNYNFIHVVVISENTDILVKNDADGNSKTRSARLINDKFVADEMNNNRISLSDINKLVDGELKPVGCKVYVDTLDNIIDRLSKLEE